MKINPAELKKVYDKFKAVGGAQEEFHKELKKAAQNTRDKARNDFKPRSKDKKGLKSNIRYRTIKRKKAGSAYEVTIGSDPVMAYIEFGTRTETIDTSGIEKLFGSLGRRFALQFRKSNAKKFTNRKAKPYFYMNAYNELEKFKKRMQQKIAQAVRK